MFTLLVQKSNGIETLYSADRVSKEPNALLMWGNNHHQGVCVISPTGDEMACEWDRVIRDTDTTGTDFGLCRIFVMNEVGKTIANYSFSDMVITKTVAVENWGCIVPYAENDVENILVTRQDSNKLWYPLNRTVSLYDLSLHMSYEGFLPTRRTATITASGGVRTFLVKITKVADKETDWFELSSNDSCLTWRYADDNKRFLRASSSSSVPFLIDRNVKNLHDRRSVILDSLDGDECVSVCSAISFEIDTLTGKMSSSRRSCSWNNPEFFIEIEGFTAAIYA